MTTDPKLGGGEPSGIREGFVKRRRSLIALSVVLALYHFGNVSIKDIDVFGIEMELSNQSAITFLLWIAWSYFLVTFGQYHWDLEDRSFEGAVNKRFEKAAEVFAEKEFRHEFESTLIENGVPKNRTIERIFIESEKVQHVEPKDNMPSWMVSIRGMATYKDGTVYSNSGLIKSQIPIDDKRARRIRAAAFVSTLIRSRYLSEYLLPYVIAVVLVVSLALSVVIGR